MKRNKAITLISLVITIILLIILAGISINLVIGDGGLIDKAKKTKPMVDIATAKEKLELVKAPVLTSKYELNLDNYLEKLEEVKEENNVDYIEKVNDTNAEVIVGGKYKFLITDEENGNLKIEYQGEAGGLELSSKSGTYTYPNSGTFKVTKNESGGALSVKSENENIAKAEINGTTITVIPQNKAGIAKIIVTSAANGDYAEGKATYTATVNRGTITLTATAYTGNYDGKEHDAITNVTVTPTDAKVEYSLNGGAFSTTIPKVNGANSYKIAVKASKEGYTTKTISKAIDKPIGEYINYPIDLNGDGDTTNDWMIFYISDGKAEGEESGGAYNANIGDYYIIAADFLNNTDSRLNLEKIGAEKKENGEYSIYWPSSTVLPVLQRTGNETLIVNQRANTTTTINKLFMQNKYGTLNSSYFTSRIASTLINTENWIGYVNSNYADYAIGTPTIEMWVGSWNLQYGEQLKLYTNTGTLGYYVGTGSNSTTSDYQTITEVTDWVNNELLFPHANSTYNGCYGYWLASSSISWEYNLMSIYSGGRRNKLWFSLLWELLYTSSCTFKIWNNNK